MNTLSGWIKVYRKFSEWEWHDNPNMVSVWVHLLILANYEDKQWHDITIERGQISIGLESFSKTVGISVRELRTCLDRLCHLDMIMKKSTNKNTIITICNYDKYQSGEDDERQTNDKQTTNKRQTNDKQSEKEKKNPPTPPIKENKKINQEGKNNYHVVDSARAREEEFKKNGVIESVEELAEELREEISIVGPVAESAMRLYRVTPQQLQEYVGRFVDKLKLDGTTIKSHGDFRRHFANWLRIQVTQNTNNNNNGNRNTNPERPGQIADAAQFFDRL